MSTQEGWSRYADWLMAVRFVDVQMALRAVRKTHALLSGRPEIIDELGMTVLRIRKLSRHAKSVRRAAGAKGAESGWEQAREVRLAAETLLMEIRQAISGLPETMRGRIDEFLCESHRRRIVRGNSKRPRRLLSQGVHSHAMVGLALSGGGIRSASFSIGVLQALAVRGIQPAVQYLSSVSGGGYAASWLMAWAYRHKKGILGVKEELNPERGGDCGPLWWLRQRSSYLAPRRSLTTTSDTPALLVAYIFNWLPIFVLIAAGLATTLLVPHTVVYLARWLLSAPSGWQSAAVVLCIASLTVLLGVVRALTMFCREPAFPRRDASGMSATVMFAATALAIVFCATVPVLRVALVPQAVSRSEPSWLPQGYSPERIVLFLWIVAYMSALFIAFMFSRTITVALIDKGRQFLFGIRTAARAPMEWLPVPKSRLALGVAFGVATGSALTLYMLRRMTDAGVEHSVTVFGPLVVLLVLALSEMMNAFLSNRFMREVDRAWAARVGGWLAFGAVVWLVVAATALLADEALGLWAASSEVMRVLWTVMAFVGVVVLIHRDWYIPLYGCIAVVFLVCFSTIVVSPLLRWSTSAGIDAPQLLGLAAVATMLLGIAVNVNRYSLHALYREGLVRTFLGASRLGHRNPNIAPSSTMRDGEEAQFQARQPDPVTDIDDDDNPALAWLQTEADRPLPVFLLNAAVNGVRWNDATGLAPRQWPYTFSQYFCGSPVSEIGYSRSALVFSKGNVKPLTLGTAMAVSGAAVSPTAGRTTHPLKAFVFGLLNARLGLWVGSPQAPGEVVLESPTLSGLVVLREMLGIRPRFTKRTKWIHLSDGGHFENLGVYELLRRGCSRIIVVDGSCDPAGDMSDLANAIRRARIDLGVEVRHPLPTDFAFDEEKLDGELQSGSINWSDFPVPGDGPGAAVRAVAPRPEPTDFDASQHGAAWRWFTIEYGGGLPLGRMLYIKPSLQVAGQLPVEVHQYAKQSPSFPHETTADQFFTEAQLEAYRSLGKVCGEEAMKSVVDARSMTLPSYDIGLQQCLLRTWKRQYPPSASTGSNPVLP